MHATTQIVALPNNPKYAAMIEKFKQELDLPQHHVTSPPLHKRSPLTVTKKQLPESLITVLSTAPLLSILPTTQLNSSSSPSHRFNFYPAKKFSRYVRYAVAICAMILLRFRNFSRNVAFLPPIATHDEATNHAGDDRYLSKNGSIHSMYSSVQPITDAVVLTNTTNEPEPLSDNDDSEDAIVVLLNDWTEFEQMVDSIWTGNMFCDKIYYKVYLHNKNIITSATDQTKNHSDVPGLPKVHVQIELSCHDLFLHSKHGTGNYIQAIYMMRLAVQYISTANVKLNVTCIDSEQLEKDYVLPWFTGTWYSPNYFNSTTSTKALPMYREMQGKSAVVPQETVIKRMYCGPYYRNPISIMHKEMQYDVRRMAIAIVGTSLSQTNHTHSAKIEQFIQENLYRTDALHGIDRTHDVFLSAGNQQERFNATTNIVPLVQPKQPIEFDDAIIHFRCGDLLSTTLTSYGFMTFHGYSRHISTHVRTIGILTQPFGAHPNATNISESFVIQQRGLDTDNVQQMQRCQTLVFAFVDYLQEQFPNAIVRIRNDPTETITLAYSRMVMANETVAGMSTFSVFPILGTFGTGYYLRPKTIDPSTWLAHWKYPITNMIRQDSNIVLFDESNLLLGPKAKDLWDTHGDDVVLQWFRTGTYTLDHWQGT